MQPYSNGVQTWTVTFRSLIGDVELLSVDPYLLYGSNANVQVAEVTMGSSMSLYGENPRLTVEEKVAGLPSYKSSYVVDTPGKNSQDRSIVENR